MKKGVDNIVVSAYFNLDTAFTNKHGVRIISGDITKLEVRWNYEDYKSIGLGVIKGYNEDVPVPYYRSIADTKLYQFFKSYPFYTDEDWPRVCINVTHFPEIYSEELYFMADPQVGQFEEFKKYPPISMQATIWMSEEEKIEIPAFAYLPCDFDTYGVPTADVLSWGMGYAQSMMKENTGYKRTAGPTPPQHHLPQTPFEHKTFFEHSSPGIAVVADVLHKLGYDWNKIGDRRVWFNIMDPE